jgi:hypothetical protein
VTADTDTVGGDEEYNGHIVFLFRETEDWKLLMRLAGDGNKSKFSKFCLE